MGGEFSNLSASELRAVFKLSDQYEFPTQEFIENCKLNAGVLTTKSKNQICRAMGYEDFKQFKDMNRVEKMSKTKLIMLFRKGHDISASVAAIYIEFRDTMGKLTPMEREEFIEEQKAEGKYDFGSM